MHLGLIIRTQHPNFNKASSQKELFLNQHCCIIGIILESHKPLFKKCFGDITACSPIENAAGKLVSQAQKGKKNLSVSTGKQHSSAMKYPRILQELLYKSAWARHL